MISHSVHSFFTGGFIGVNIFFVLSGFLITSTLMHEYNASSSIIFWKFYMRRFLRLAPALVALLAAVCIYSRFWLNGADAARNYVDVLICLFYFSNWARAFSIHAPDLVAHTWSLSVEEQFYLLWPILLLTLLRCSTKRAHAAVAVVLMGLMSTAWRLYLYAHDASGNRISNGLDTRADALLVGCVLGIILSSEPIGESARKKLGKLFFFAAPLSAVLLLVYFNMKWDQRQMDGRGFFITELLAAVLICDIIVRPHSVVRKVFEMKWLAWVGSISYGLYLWHYPIDRMMPSFGFSGADLFVLEWALAFALAAASFYGLEKPILNFKKRFAP